MVRAALSVVVAASVLVVSGASATPAAGCSVDAYVPSKTLPRFYPPLVSGDGNFAGHGPAITVSAKRKLFSGVLDAFIVVVKMKAEETQSDWTIASGTQSTFTLYTGPSGCNIERASTTGSFDSNGYLARALFTNPYSLPAGDTDSVNKNFVLAYTVWDDRTGADVNGYTSVQVKTRPFTVHFATP
jgi:hypothetical protein